MPIIEQSSGSVIFIYFSIAAPIFEEVIYRGFIQGYWFKKSPKIGIIVSTIIFTLVHFPNNAIVFVDYFLGSLIFGIVYLKTKRLEVTTGIHILNNLPAGIQALLNLF